MRIEKIELIGFKSFADRTNFVLHPGVTCIVGPNGCGKSNIVDAFRWVLGEQSAKSLRGEKMEEVIFNGSASKKPKGMAEVTLLISGMNGASPGNGDGRDETVTISRRLFRSGESEYMINKTPCRLKDIKDVFLDTGLDFRSYSILEQGRIGEILNSKPIDRRFIIEEVAGVMKYKVRKAEALSKLESARTNLVRINDIITEVKKQINILDRLAKKAERYKKLTAEMHSIELKIARNEYGQIRESLEGLCAEHDLLKEKEAVMAAEISDTESRTESRRLALLELEKELEQLQQRFQALEKDISDIERSIAVARNDISNLGEYNARLIAQEEEIVTRTGEIEARLEELKLSTEQVASEIEADASLLRDKTEEFRTMEEELADREDEIEKKRREVFRTSEQLSSMKNELGRYQNSFESLERREATSTREVEEARKALEGVEKAIGSVEAEILGSNSEAMLLREKKDVLIRELTGERERLSSLSAALASAREELASLSSRLGSLREIVLDSPTRDLISAGEKVDLIAMFSDIIEVEAEYERAIEAALAERADAFILGSSDDVRNAVASVKEKGIGRTAFLVSAAQRLAVGHEPPVGIIGPALGFVKTKEGFETVAENLLGRILIVSDLQAAMALRQTASGYLLVTKDGEVVDTSGAVIVGEGKGIFKRKREIRELEEAVEDKKAAIERLTEQTQSLQASISGREEDVRGVETSIFKLEKEISLSRLTVENYTDEKERTNRKLAYLTLELEEIGREKGSLSNLISETEGKVGAIDARKAECETEIQTIIEGISLQKSRLEEHRAEVTDIRLTTASNKERLDSLKNETESSRRLIGDLENRKSDLASERDRLHAKKAERESEISGAEGRLRTLVAEADAFRADLSRRREVIDAEREELLSVDQGLKTLRQQISAVSSRLGELDVSRTEHRMRIENLEGNVRNIYGMEIGSIEPAEVTEEEQARLAELRDKVREMGPVNLGTLEEYEELTNRYDFLSRQHEDLTKSIAELEEAISKINSTTRKKLRDAYDSLNAKFGEVFTSLFGGGRAELLLTDEHNILETGIDIVAQPPGKKLQNIHLLSGGEKALTALSIQFASFLIKPTPLCILDEADAPLDESNTERFSKMIEELSSGTQFIVVTHNRTTMNAAQHLYGITMEEAGVSKVISVQLTEV